MRALIRDTEIYFESEWIPFTRVNLEWVITSAPKGDGYALCEDCPVGDPEPQDFDISEVQVPDASAPAEEDGTAEIPTVTRRVAVFSQDRYNARKAQEAQE